MAEQHGSALGVVKKLLKPFQAVGRAITRAINLVLVFLVYFLVIGPLSLILRVTGQRLLEATPISDDTYWVARRETGGALEQFRRQF